MPIGLVVLAAASFVACFFARSSDGSEGRDMAFEIVKECPDFARYSASYEDLVLAAHDEAMVMTQAPGRRPRAKLEVDTGTSMRVLKARMVEPAEYDDEKTISKHLVGPRERDGWKQGFPGLRVARAIGLGFLTEPLA